VLLNRQWWAQTKAWRVPSLYAVCALTAGITLPRLETRFLPALMSGITVSAATAIYSSVASGMIALTGIVFSLTFVMVQFSATAYSPRLVLWLARDRLLSHTLGTFIATFLYALAALAWVGRGTANVPFVSAIAVVGLLLASVSLLVALIERIARLQINRMLGFTGDRGREVIDALYAPITAPRSDIDASREPASPVQAVLAHHGRPMVVQLIDIGGLVRLAGRCDGLIEVVAAVGDTIVGTSPLAHVVTAQQPIAEHAVRNAIVLGDERTFEQDPKYAIRILVDIAVKALSPAVNDPTTAVQALDQIGDLLLRLSRRRLEIGAFRDTAGTLRVVIPFPSWEDFLRLAFSEICCYGATSVQVMRRMKALINDLITAVTPERREPLRHWNDRLASSIARHFTDPDEKTEASAEDRQGLGVSRRHAPPTPAPMERPDRILAAG
jgi:uncharacterized membrane protein